MTDTPKHIYDLQLKLWLNKTPGERLYQSMRENEALLKFFKEVKPATIPSEKVILSREPGTKKIIQTTIKINK